MDLHNAFLPDPPELSVAEREELKGLLDTRAFQRALEIVRYHHNASLQGLRSAPLGTPEGVNEAVRIQGKAEGMLYAIEVIADACQEPERTEDGT